MLATDFLKFAHKEGACIKGLLWLAVWIKYNPKGTIEEFFKEKSKKSKTILITKKDYIELNKKYKFRDTSFFPLFPLYPDLENIHINNELECDFLRWIFRCLLDWDHTYYGEYILELFNVISLYNVPKNKLANFLILAFEDQ